jgi:hypothetical protein
MTRRQLNAAAAAALAACPATARLAAAPPAQAPTVDDLINLAEHGSDPNYYGRVLSECLAETGTVARDNGDGSISMYSPDGGWTWRKKTVLNSVRPVPAGLLQRFKPAQRGDGFPARILFNPL